MKKHAFLSLSMLILSGLILTSCGSHTDLDTSSNSLSTPSETETTQGNTSTVDPVITIKRLEIKTMPDKVEFEVGEKFSSAGLKVNLVETVDGKVISSNETSDFSLSINEGTILEEGTFEVMIKGRDKNIRSTSYEITVSVKTSLGSLYSVVKKMVDLNNYTVNNDLGQDNHVKGLMTKDALIWDASEQAYFMDEDYGYGSYNNKTFRFNLNADNKVVNAIYLTDLGGNAEDHGLFDINTVDDMAERRISNYNIKGITDKDLAYLKNEIKPTEENPNKYLLAIEHSKWLFNAIGHTQLTINPIYFLNSGSEPAKIWLEVKDYGLDVNLITFDTFGVRGCSAKISDIGTTVIPGMKEFMKNPVFGKAKTNLDKLQVLLLNQNYEFMFNDETRNAVFNSSYVYGDYLNDVNGVNYNTISLYSGNSLNKAEGIYNLSIVDNQVNIGAETSKSVHLSNFDIFRNLNDYFVQDQVMLNRYSYIVEQDMFEASGLKDFVKTFTNYKDEVIEEVSLDCMMMGGSVYQVTLDIYTSDTTLDSIMITNFGNASNSIIDNFVESLY